MDARSGLCGDDCQILDQRNARQDWLCAATKFGYPGSRTGHAGYPQAQCAVLIECASHAIIAANLGAYREAEWTICKPLLSSLNADMLCLADRGFNGHAHWTAAVATGAQLLWRISNKRQLPVVKALGDGSYLSVIYPSDTRSKKQWHASSDGIAVRVIDYALPNATEGQPRYRGNGGHL